MWVWQIVVINCKQWMDELPLDLDFMTLLLNKLYTDNKSANN